MQKHMFNYAKQVNLLFAASLYFVQVHEKISHHSIPLHMFLLSQQISPKMISCSINVCGGEAACEGEHRGAETPSERVTKPLLGVELVITSLATSHYHSAFDRISICITMFSGKED